MLYILYRGWAPTEAPCKKDGKSHCPMAEFTLIKRRKNLIFLQTPLLLPMPFEVSALELQTLQAGMANPAKTSSTCASF